jgi:CRP/FNR family transcriptional regulator, dissimilatory nitrate respiration regulator
MPINSLKAKMKSSESLAYFTSLPLFTNLPPEDIKNFSNAAHTSQYKKGKVLFIEDEKADFFYIILSGWVRLFHTTEEGEEINLAILTNGNAIGESALFDKGRYSSSAQIAENAQVMRIPLELLNKHLRVSQQMAFNMLTVMTQYQRRHALQMELYHLYSAPQRIGCFLLGLCPPREQLDGVQVDLPYDKSLIASSLGMKGATFSRALNILRQQTGLRIQGTRVTVDSIRRLLDFVNGCYLETLLKKV